MIPISLKISGFYSYKSPQTINFDNLCENKLFGIFGSVGAGKSAILDAITLSLYGSVDRLNSKEKRNYNIVNLKSDKMFIEFTFKSANNIYQFIVSAQRNKKYFEKIEDFEHKAYKKQNDDSWVPLDLSKKTIGTLTEKILGLSYENFNRTIIIPQGKFQEFIKLSPSERTNMLSEIFGLQKFDLYANTYSSHRETKAEYDKVKGQLEALSEYSQESLSKTEEELQNHINIIKNIEAELSNQKNQEIVLTNILKLTQEKEQAVSTLVELQNRQADIERTKKHIALKEHCSIHYKDLLMRKDELSNNLKERLDRYNQADTDLKNLQVPLQKANTELHRINNIIKDKDKLYQELIETKNAIKLKSTLKDIEKLKQSLSQTATKLKIQIEKEDYCKNEITKLKEKIYANNKQKIKQETLDQIHSWHIKLGELNQKRTSIETNKEYQKEQLDKQKQEVINLMENSFPNCHRSLEKLKKLKQQTQKDYIDCIIDKSLKKICNNLSPGDECPICKSPINENNVHDIKHISDTLPLQTEALLKSTIEKIDKIEVNVQLFIQNKHKFDEHCKTYDNDLNLIHKQIQEHYRSYEWENIIKCDYDAFKSLKDQQIRFQNEDHNTTENIRNLEIELGNIDKQITLLNSYLHEKELQLKLQENNEIHIENTFTLNKRTYYETLSEEELSISIAQKEYFFKNIDSNHEKIKKNADELNHKEIAIKEKISLIKNDLEHLKAEIDNVNNKINSLVNNDTTLKNLILTVYGSDKFHGELTLNLLKTVILKEINSNFNIIVEKKRIDEFSNQLEVLHKQIKLIDNQLGTTKYDKKVHEELRLQISKLEEEKNNYFNKQGELNERINTIRNKLKEIEVTNNRYKTLDKRLYNLNILLKLFHSKGFMQYISQSYIKNLCFIANKHFTKMNNNNLSIEFQDDQFIVRDHLNEDKTRNIKTLSGGQMFQASLSMAIALSDNLLLNTKTNKQSFFFLDEGFGSLDKESINTVINTLNKLRHENRIIGLISHVDEIKEQIHSYITIQNNEELGSVVKHMYQLA